MFLCNLAAVSQLQAMAVSQLVQCVPAGAVWFIGSLDLVKNTFKQT